MARGGGNKGKQAGAARVGGFGVFVLILLVVGFCAVALYGVWAFWPSEKRTGPGLVPSKDVHYFWWTRELSRESLFFVTVAFAGALGGMVHSVRSLVVYLGTRKLLRSWTPFYLMKPVLGALLATLLYFVLRAGLFSPSASTDQASPYGFAAIAALAGLFSDQAVEKLKSIAEQLFQETTVSKDHYSQDAPVAVTGDAEPGIADAVVKGTVNPNGRETRYVFEYGPTTSYVSTSEEQSAGAGEEDVPVEATLTPLDQGTTYHYRLVATNEAGRSEGEDKEFTTLTV